MTDSEINSYLEREIFKNRGIVTFRLLSRKLSMHVNTAKNVLASFYSQKRENAQPIYATFWLSGEPKGRSTNGTSDDMEVDSENGKDWLTRKIFIVGEEDLESVRATFSKIHALHVYSLSAIPLNNASQLCGPSQEIREMDRAGGDDLARTVGKVSSREVKRGMTVKKSIKASSSIKPQASTPSVTKPKPEEKPREKLKPHHSLDVAEEGKPKASGKLNWAKAKPKDVEKESPGSKISSKEEELKEEPIIDNKEKRGTKRKSIVTSQLRGREEESEEEESEEEGKGEKLRNNPAYSIKAVTEDASAVARVKKGVVLSDDDDEQIVVKARNSGRGKAKASDDSNTERSVRAMMDIDDSDVIKASRSSIHTVPNQDEDEEPPATDHVDSAMDEDSEDPAPKAKPRKRKQKKVVPIGRNGLRKKRVVKSKTDFDEKGYMVTVDYSSYESVDEDEEEAAMGDTKSRTKLKSTTVKKTPAIKKGDMSASESETKAHVRGQSPVPVTAKKSEVKKSSAKPPIPKGRQSNGSQKSLASFFGSGGGKAKK